MTICLSNVRFSYPSVPDKVVLNIPKWSVASQEHVFVHGPSGGGKSTLLNLLGGMCGPSEGEVSVLGERLDLMSQRQRDRFRANNIGYVFQQFNLIPYLNALENIRLARQFASNRKERLTDEDIQALLEKLQLTSEDSVRPSRLLSIGQQQRVAIARALVNKPKVLIADEPTSSLDQKNRDNFMALLLSIAEYNDITLVFVSHDMSLSHHFSRIDALSELNDLEVNNLERGCLQPGCLKGDA